MRRLWLAALLLFAPALAAQDLAARDLKIGVSQYPATFNPLLEASVIQSYVNGMTRRPITAYDADWELVCLLCVELPTFENGLAVREPLSDGGEGVAVTYELKPGIAWGDGTPVTAEDVVFTWEVGRHPLSGVIAAEGFRRILAIDVHDERRFTLHLDRITYNYNAFGSELLPAHIERPIFEADPANYRTRTRFDATPQEPGLYFGPYRIVSLTPGSEVVLERNPTWFGEPPAFERVRVVTVSSTATLEANLLSGAIDMIAGELGLQIDQALALERRHGTSYRILYNAGLFYEHIDLNLDSPALQDVRVRRALLLALDRESLTQQLFGGQQPVAQSPISPLDGNLADEIPAYPYDPALAAQLLEEAGWSLGGGGVWRTNPEGVRLSLSFATTAGDRTRELVQQVLQAQWKAVGIEVKIDNQPARVLFGQSLRQRQFGDMAMFAWIASPESPMRTILHSEEIPTQENGWSGQNATGYASPEMDAIIDRLEVELDPGKRQSLWAQLQRLYMGDLPVLPLYWRANTYILPLWLEGVTPTGHQMPTTLWIETWRVAE